MTAILTEKPACPAADRHQRLKLQHQPPYNVPDANAPSDAADEPSELEEIPGAVIDEADWDVFVADEDEYDPLPDPGDFWLGD